MLLAALAVAAATLPPIVAPPADAACKSYDLQFTTAPLMTVRPGPPGQRAYLQDQAKPCARGAQCGFVRKAYLVPGDMVLASRPLNGFRCVFFAANGQPSAGFVADAALVSAPTQYSPLDPAFLTGAWREADDNLRFKMAMKRLVVDGDAVWPSAKPPPGWPKDRFVPNIGEVAGAVRLSGPRFEVGDPEEEGRVWGWRRGPYLVVGDNGNCGGHNVRFQGVYRRTGR